MANNDPRQWMWGEAVDMLARAERMHRQLFQPSSAQARRPSWEPPVDVLETEGEIVIIAALPGGRRDLPCSSPSKARAFGDRRRAQFLRQRRAADGGDPSAGASAGVFPTSVALPAGRYDQIRHRTQDGCLVVTLRKLA